MNEEVTVVVSIGNSDDKLTQSNWSAFVWEVNQAIETQANQVHFHGYSPGDKPWQNAAWYFDIDASVSEELKPTLAAIAQRYDQDSVAWLIGRTEFVAGKVNPK